MTSSLTSTTASINDEELLFDILPLTTSRMARTTLEYGSPSLFQYEALIAGIAIFFFRITIQGNFWVKNSNKNGKSSSSSVEEPTLLRYFFATMLSFLAYSKKSYELILAVEVFSYFVPWILFVQQQQLSASFFTNSSSPLSLSSSTMTSVPTTLLLIGCSALFSMLFTHYMATGTILKILKIITPKVLQNFILYLIPVHEVTLAYNLISRFAENKDILHQQLYHILFVTFHIQVGMGYLGIEFLRKEQQRRNQLIRISDDEKSNQRDNHDENCEDDNDKQKQFDESCSKPAIPNKKTISDQHQEGKKIESKSKFSQRIILGRARSFQRTAPAFILFAAIPYMAQLIFYGNINRFAFLCLNDDMHRLIRLDQLFDHDNHLIQMVTESATSPEAYANSMSTIVETTYDLFNRKLFSLPKVLLLPLVFSKEPMLLLQVFPFIFFSDWVKGRAVSYMTTKIEKLQKEMHDLKSIRTRIESFDLKNAELLQRSGVAGLSSSDHVYDHSSSNSMDTGDGKIKQTNIHAHQLFTKKRWEDLTIKIQQKTVVSDLIQRTKSFFNWIQRNFVFVVLIDCALAELLAFNRILPSEVFVYSRAVEDAVDMILMRSRSEAELARMITEVDKLTTLANIWDIETKNKNSRTELADSSLSRNLLPCHLPISGEGEDRHPRRGGITLRNLHYSRGTASVRADHVDIMPGIYALTGANGSGKSTLFRVLMSCSTNEKPIDLPASIVFSRPTYQLIEEDDVARASSCKADIPPEVQGAEETEAVNEEVKSSQGNEVIASENVELSINMPSSHVVEISQTFYWPLYTKPIDWIYQEHLSETLSAVELQKRVHKVAIELHSLSFFGGTANDKDDKDKEDDEDDEIDASEKDRLIFEQITKDLMEEKEDWFNDLSGGQKSKVELVRKVFLQNECPRVLLIDETMAPLDPISKAMVMNKVKSFCKNGDSIVIVIYHTDVQQQEDDNINKTSTKSAGKNNTNAIRNNENADCVPSSNFFDHNIHLENHMIHIRPVC